MDSTREDIAIEDFLESCESKDLGHLGLVAGTSEELEIGRRIDDHIAQDFSQREVSVGQAARAMVLNGLGFAQQSLYLTPQFFESKPTERLIGEGIEPGHFHDDTLGRPKKRPEAVAGDRAYDSKENRKWCWERNIESVIPARNGMHTGPGRPPNLR